MFHMYNIWYIFYFYSLFYSAIYIQIYNLIIIKMIQKYKLDAFIYTPMLQKTGILENKYNNNYIRIFIIYFVLYIIFNNKRIIILYD